MRSNASRLLSAILIAVAVMAGNAMALQPAWAAAGKTVTPPKPKAAKLAVTKVSIARNALPGIKLTTSTTAQPKSAPPAELALVSDCGGEIIAPVQAKGPTTYAYAAKPTAGAAQVHKTAGMTNSVGTSAGTVAPNRLPTALASGPAATTLTKPASPANTANAKPTAVASGSKSLTGSHAANTAVAGNAIGNADALGGCVIEKHGGVSPNIGIVGIATDRVRFDDRTPNMFWLAPATTTRLATSSIRPAGPTKPTTPTPAGGSPKPGFALSFGALAAETLTEKSAAVQYDANTLCLVQVVGAEDNVIMKLGVRAAAPAVPTGAGVTLVPFARATYNYDVTAESAKPAKTFAGDLNVGGGVSVVSGKAITAFVSADWERRDGYSGMAGIGRVRVAF
jgi:hypothetical protein